MSDGFPIGWYADDRVEQFNRCVPVGSPVEVLRDDRRIGRTVTTCPAFLASDGTPVVMLQGISGYYALDRVTGVVGPTEPREVLQPDPAGSRVTVTREQAAPAPRPLWSTALAIAVIDRLITALDDSVKLQSHYAGLLNQYDGGQRLQFKSADEWLARLRETGRLPDPPEV